MKQNLLFLLHIKNQKRFVEIISPISLALLFCFMASWSWRKWPDILIDFGRELYLPWKINRGQVLYKDLAHLFGPFSSYFNALLFKLFGTSYTVLIISNILLAVLMLSIFYILICNITSARTSHICCAVVISVFIFSQYDIVGNYNFISPYSHEATHGIILSLLLMFQLYKFITKKSNYSLTVAGLIFGLIFLTKVEIFLSAFASTIFFFILIAINTKDYYSILKKAGVFFLLGMVPIIIFFLYFWHVMPIHEAVSSILIPWKVLFNKGITSNQFYISSMGINNIIDNLKIMFFHSVIIVLIVSAIYFLSCCYVKYSMTKVKYLCFICFVIIIGVSFYYITPINLGRSLPILNFIFFLILIKYYLKFSPEDPIKPYQLILLLTWSAFAICLLSKILLNCRVFHYGFYLALPSVILVIIMFIWFIPEVTKHKISEGRIFRNVLIIIIIAISGHCVLVSYKIYKKKSYPIGSAIDRIITYDSKISSHEYYISMALKWICSNISPEETFVVLPEGIMLNYLAKRTNPTRFTNFMVPELSFFKEDIILNNFIKNSPDYFILVHKDTSEYGVSYFGQKYNYGKKIMDWITMHYDTICLFGSEPLINGKFGIKILKRTKG